MKGANALVVYIEEEGMVVDTQQWFYNSSANNWVTLYSSVCVFESIYRKEIYCGVVGATVTQVSYL